MRKHLLALVALLGLALGLLAPPGAARAAVGEWQDGKHDEDTIWNCITESLSTGVSANVGWRSATDQVPKVGEVFWLRGYIGLVGMPCSGKVAVLPEIMVPSGVEYAEGDVVWDLTRAGEEPDLGTDPISVDHGQNGGILIGNPDGTPFTLRQGDVLEFRFPVRATRELKGPATQQPECQDRRDGTAPCPISEAGDHLQIAFTVGGHGGDKSYVTPYVGLFAAATTAPATKVASRTTATYRVSSRERGVATVKVTSSRRVTGVVRVTDRGRLIGRATLRAGDGGRVKVRLPRLSKGWHVLKASYGGSATVKPSSSPKQRIRVR